VGENIEEVDQAMAEVDNHILSRGLVLLELAQAEDLMVRGIRHRLEEAHRVSTPLRSSCSLVF